MLNWPDVSDISTQKTQTGKKAWFFSADEKEKRPPGLESASTQGASTTKPGLMSKSGSRLTREAVAETIARGRVYRGGSLALRVSTARTAGVTLSTVVVSGRQVKLAVDRNLLKRRLRSLLQRLSPTFVPGYQLVVFASRQSLELKFSELAEELVVKLKQAKIIK